MKLSLRQIWNSQQALQKLVSQDLDLKASYWIGKQVKKLNCEFEAINEQRNKLVIKYGEKQKDGNYKVKDNYKFQKEFNKFLETEMEVELELIRFDYLKDAKLSPADFISLDFLIQAPKEKNETPPKTTEPAKMEEPQGE
jgi:hypothetical protein